MGLSPENSQRHLVEAIAEAEWTCPATGGAGFGAELEALVETDWTCSATKGAGFDAELRTRVENGWTCSAAGGAGFGAEFEALAEADFSAKLCPHGVTLPLIQLSVSLASSSVTLLCVMEKYTEVAHRPTLCLYGRQVTLNVALQATSSLNCL
jgi:hypothetical protein